MHWDVTAGLVEATVERGKEDEAVEGGRVEVVVVIVEVGASIEEVRGKVEVAGFSSQILVSLLYRQVVACRHSLFVRLSHVNAVEADAGPRKSAVRISNAARVKQCISSLCPLLFFFPPLFLSFFYNHFTWPVYAACGRNNCAASAETRWAGMNRVRG